MGSMTDGIVYIITTNYGMNHELVTCSHIASLILTLRANFGYLDKSVLAMHAALNKLT
jgi:hypothetical protein